MSPRFSEYPPRSKVAIVLGILLLVLGSIGVYVHIVNLPLLQYLGWVFKMISAWVAPIALVVGGIYVLWAVKTGRLENISKGRHSSQFVRSATDKRFAGICGGLAAYFGIDSIVVRIIVLLLFFATPLLVLVTYIVLAIVIPQE